MTDAATHVGRSQYKINILISSFTIAKAFAVCSAATSCYRVVALQHSFF